MGYESNVELRAVEALMSMPRRAHHLSAIAVKAGLNRNQVSSSLSQNAKSADPVVERTRKGYYRVKPEFYDAQQKPSRARSEPPQITEVTLPPTATEKVFQYVGEIPGGMLVRDPDTFKLYIAKPLEV